MAGDLHQATGAVLALPSGSIARRPIGRTRAGRRLCVHAARRHRDRTHVAAQEQVAALINVVTPFFVAYPF